MWSFHRSGQESYFPVFLLSVHTDAVVMSPEVAAGSRRRIKETYRDTTSVRGISV